MPLRMLDWMLSSSNEHPVYNGPLCSKKNFNNTSIINHLGIKYRVVQKKVYDVILRKSV